MEKLNYLAQLNLLVRSVEVDLGITDVSPSEKAILSAISLLATSSEVEVSVQKLLEHELITEIPKPTVYRALKSLVGVGLLEKVRFGRYAIPKNPLVN
jgi:Fe2+ or Zn2+ uptake regulation protein